MLMPEIAGLTTVTVAVPDLVVSTSEVAFTDRLAAVSSSAMVSTPVALSMVVPAFAAPLTDQVTVAGQGHVHLWLRPGTEDTSVQVTLTEIRPDGMEVRVQSGWHRPVHRVEDLPPPKSIGNSATAPRDLICEADARAALLSLAESVGARLRLEGYQCRLKFGYRY